MSEKVHACDDPEVSTPRTAKGPEQLRLTLAVCLDDAAVGEDDPGAREPVRSQPVSASCVTEAAAERQTRQSDSRARAGRQAETVLLQCGLRIDDQRTASDRGALVRYLDGGESLEVDDHALCG